MRAAASDAHEHDERSRRPRSAASAAAVQPSCPLTHVDRRRDAAVRQRDAGGGGTRQRAAHAGHDLDRDARLAAREHLLAAAAVHERVAALEPHDDGPRWACSTRIRLISCCGTGWCPGSCRRR